MGAVHGGIPKDFTLAIRDACGCRAFVETGTFKGATTVWAAENFEKVVTAEVCPEMFSSAAPRLSPFANVDARLGDSRVILEDVLPALASMRPLIWLDAHVCGEEDKDSPLLEEVMLVNRHCPDAAIFIDDARFILSAYGGRRLCTLDGLLRTLDCARYGRYVVVLQDIVVAVPLSARGAVDDYCRQATVAEWEAGRRRQMWDRTAAGRVCSWLQRVTGRSFGGPA